MPYNEITVVIEDDLRDAKRKFSFDNDYPSNDCGDKPDGSITIDN